MRNVMVNPSTRKCHAHCSLALCNVAMVLKCRCTRRWGLVLTECKFTATRLAFRSSHANCCFRPLQFSNGAGLHLYKALETCPFTSASSQQPDWLSGVLMQTAVSGLCSLAMVLGCTCTRRWRLALSRVQVHSNQIGFQEFSCKLLFQAFAV